MQSKLRILNTLFVSLCGVAIFWLLDLPLPFLFGPMFASLFAALAGMKLKGTGQISVGARTILGVAVGTSVTPQVLGQIPQMLASVALIPIYLAIIALVGLWFFHRICRFDRATAYYSAMPGGFQDMVVFGQEAGGNVRALSLIHATRVLVIVTLAPLILSQVLNTDFDKPIGTPAADIPGLELALLAIAAIAGWKGGERIGLFGASIIGPMILAGVLSITGFVHYRPPSEAILIAQFFVGAGIGVGYVGVNMQEIRKYVSTGFVYVIFLILLSFVFTEIVVFLGLASPLNSYLAFLPGGQAEMAVIAIIVGADLGYIIVHHLTRLILVITGSPIFAALLKLKTNRNRQDSE